MIAMLEVSGAQRPKHKTAIASFIATNLDFDRMWRKFLRYGVYETARWWPMQIQY